MSRTKGSKNRPRDVIEAERAARAAMPKRPRGRPPGSRNGVKTVPCAPPCVEQPLLPCEAYHVPMSLPNNDSHACASCGAAISNRHAMRICARCSLNALGDSLKADGYYERNERALLRREEEEAAERLRARGILTDKETT